MREQILVLNKIDMLIGYDEARESVYHLHRKKKEMHLENLMTMCSEVIEIKDKDEFIKNPRKYVVDQYKLISGLKNVKEEEFLKLVDLPIREINKSFEAYSTYGSVDLNAPIPNFEIHTTNKDQDNEYKAILKLCDALNSYKQPLPLQVQFIFNGDVILKDSKWMPNPYRILLF